MDIIDRLRQAGYTEEQLYEAGFGEIKNVDSEEDSES